MSRFVALCVAVLLGVVPLSRAVAADAPVTTLTITASDYKFAPEEITVKVGEPVTLKFTSGGGVHGIESKDLGIQSTTIVPGGGTTVTFTPKKAGTYLLHCVIPCGPGHADMALTIKVTA